MNAEAEWRWGNYFYRLARVRRAEQRVTQALLHHRACGYKLMWDGRGLIKAGYELGRAEEKADWALGVIISW